MSLLVGLTGGIGCGKTTVANFFAECGATVIDCDEISHQLTQAGGGAIEAIRTTFGDDYFAANGALDRTRMRQRIFSDAGAKQSLEAILHPLIRQELLAQVRYFGEAAPYLLLVIPLLLETKNYCELVQRTLVVDCAEETQIARTMQRSGLSEQEVRAIMSKQLARSERLSYADDCIVNDSELVTLQQQVARLHRNYIEISARTD